MIATFSLLAVLVAAPVPGVGEMPGPLLFSGPATELSTDFWQVAPEKSEKAWVVPTVSRERPRAVLLIPGLHVHPIWHSKATRPDRRSWQEPKSELVKELAKDFDVFAFAYAQTVPVDYVSQSPGLRDAVTLLRKAGYKEIVLIGHSAGGIIARQFVEQYPDWGVTKVIAVGSPFAGSEVAKVNVGYPKVQAPFVRSLTPEARTAATKMNSHPLGMQVEFACVVCKLKGVESDGLVFLRSQWPDDLQRFGVPAVLATVSHVVAMHHAETSKTIAKLAREKLTRWRPAEVEKAQTILFDKPKMK